MTTKAYRRMREGREQAELQVRAERLKRLQSLRKQPYQTRVAVAALLQSGGGVSASKVPYVLGVTAHYHLGHVPESHLLSTSTALEYARTAGFCLQQQLVKQIGDARAPFCIGTDTSTRSGSLGSYVVSYVQDGTPVHRFFTFDRPSSTCAEGLAESFAKIVASLTRVGGEFVGFSSDAPVTMVGVHGGLGTLMMQKAGFCSARHVRVSCVGAPARCHRRCLARTDECPVRDSVCLLAVVHSQR
jgi:hypothetical protein